MGLFSRFERHMEDGLEGAADKMFDAPISPVQISKKAEKAMRREKMVGAGKQYAPTLYTVLVNPQDDQRLFGYYPTLAGETETYLSAKASEEGLLLDGQPLVRFIVDDDLKHGKFDIIAEMVSAPIIQQLRDEEMNRYGLGGASLRGRVAPQGAPVNQAQGYGQFSRQGGQGYAQPAPQPQGDNRFAPSNVEVQQDSPVYGAPAGKEPLPYVPEDEIDRSIDYGEYAFDSQNFEGSQNGEPQACQQPYQAAPQQSETTILPGAAGAGGMQSALPVTARLTNMVSNRVYNLKPGNIVLGRGTDCDIAVSDINASRAHAELRFEPPSSWVLTDLESTNGTKVNGQHITSTVLQEGDRITIGMTNYLFSYQR